MRELIIQTGKHQGKRIRIPEREIRIGRDQACTVRLSSDDVSRQHCLLRPTADGILVRDLGSRNGTFVNEAPVLTEVLLQPGDQLRVGPLVFRVPKPRTASPPRPSSGISDDEIADWLTESETVQDSSSGDTTLNLPTTAPELDPAPKPEQPDPEPPAPSARPPSRPKSIAEEAAEIIRRHQEKTRREQGAPQDGE